MQVTLHEAKTQLSKLIAAAERGEEIIIARRDKPVARLNAVEPRTGEPPGSADSKGGNSK
jgi:prevent-host-death family protein